jgi:hypothetical protein
LEFKLPGEPSLQIKVRKPKTDNSDRALSTEAEQVVAGSAIIEAIADFPISEEHKAYLTSLRERTVYPNCNNGTLGYRDESGNIADFPKLKSLPLDLQTRLKDIYRELAADTEKFIKTLRWRCSIPGAHHSLQSNQMRFSVDGEQWHPVSINSPNMTLSEIFFKKLLGEKERHQLVLLWDQEGEPFYHELFREAWDQREKNPKSAIVIGIAAAESAVKQCIVKFDPGAEYRLQESQSSPVSEMIKDELPKLIRENFRNDVIEDICKEAGKKKDNVIPIGIRTSVHTGVAVRNKIVHTGKIPEIYEGYCNNISQATEELLLNIRDLLWIIDYYCGYDWALHNIREENLSEGSKESDKKKTFEITESGWATVRFSVEVKDNTDISKHND